jgi:hypothetical protein
MQDTLKQVDDALAAGVIGNEVHMAVTNAIAKHPQVFAQGMKAGPVDTFLSVLKWLQANLPMLQQNLQMILTVLNQILQPKTP